MMEMTTNGNTTFTLSSNRAQFFLKMETGIFEEFVGKRVKAPFRDGSNIKIARGRLEAVKDGFIKLRGERGVILINKGNVQKITCNREGKR